MSHLKCRPRRLKIKLLFNDGLFGRVAGRLQQLTTKQTFQFLKPIAPRLPLALFCLCSIIRMNGFKDKRVLDKTFITLSDSFSWLFIHAQWPILFKLKATAKRCNSYKGFSKVGIKKIYLERSSASMLTLFTNMYEFYKYIYDK